MAYEARPGTGSIFPNDRKDKDTHPDIKGDLCLEDGTVVKFAGWRKQTQAGKTFYSLKIDKPREAAGDDFRAGGSQPVAGSDKAPAAPFNDDIPW